jgi:hypothetical protein
MQRNRSQIRKTNANNKNQITQKRDRGNHEERNIMSLFNDDFSDPFDDFFSFGSGLRRRNELSLFGGGFDLFNHFKGTEGDMLSKYRFINLVSTKEVITKTKALVFNNPM